MEDSGDFFKKLVLWEVRGFVGLLVLILDVSGFRVLGIDCFFSVVGLVFFILWIYLGFKVFLFLF